MNDLLFYIKLYYRLPKLQRYNATTQQRNNKMTMITTINTTINTTIKTTIKTTVNTTTKPPKCCAANGCGKRPAPIIGDCVYCNSKFCAQHRLPETHECSKLKECRQTAKTENAERLNSQSMSSVMNVGY